MQQLLLNIVPPETQAQKAPLISLINLNSSSPSYLVLKFYFRSCFDYSKCFRLVIRLIFHSCHVSFWGNPQAEATGRVHLLQ
jgi:hypothetical protein